MLAGHLYHSLRDKVLPLADDLVVYPGHGAGSACGKNMSKETTDTLGHQKKTNYALNPALNKKEFIKQVLHGLTPPPAYFSQDVILNVRGYEPFDEVLDRSLHALSPDAFDQVRREVNPVVLDTRRAQTFAKAFIPGSVNIGLDGDFAAWAGTLIKTVTSPILIVAEPDQEKEVVTRLARVGFDEVQGFLKGGFESWPGSVKGIDSITSLNAEDVADLMQKDDALVLDVRRAKEFELGHVSKAINIPLDYIEEHKSKIPKDRTVYVYCAAGYRSMAFISKLRAEGYKNLIDVNGGFKAIQSSGRFAGLLDEVMTTTPDETFCDITKRTQDKKL
jgi:rhodanese-related sulfurtransferase